MALKIKPKQLLRTINSWSRGYCEHKSIYERDEAGPQPRMVQGKPYPEWRRPWIKRDGEWYSKLSIFVEKNPSMEVLASMQHLPNLTIADVKNWWRKMKILQEIENQKYLPERVAALGSNLAAVHFFAYRHAAVRLKDTKHWITSDPKVLEKLPNHYTDGYIVEAVDCSNFHHGGIRYEGLQNLSGLVFLKWLSLRNNKHIDVWCIDRIAGQNGKSLEFLDISACKLCVGGVFALAKMESLKVLVIADPGDDVKVQAALSFLEQENPQLLIKIVDPEINGEK